MRKISMIRKLKQVKIKFPCKFSEMIAGTNCSFGVCNINWAGFH